MKRKSIILSLFIDDAFSVFAFNYMPEVWTHCLYNGEYLGGGEVAATGYCAKLDEQEIDGHMVDITKCAPEYTFHARRCVENGPLHADIH